jgi:SPP1 gp7 family putative phage head morphogenesis protein
LSRDELKEFHWTVDEYIKRGRESNYTDKWKKQLENASAKVHITRFEALKLQLQQQLEVLYGNQVDGLDKLMKDIYTEGFRRSAFTIDTGVGVYYNLATTNPQRIDTIVNQPWAPDKKNFSDRLWRDKDKLASTLQQEMQNAVSRGDKLDTAVKNIAKRMNAAKSSAARLVMTESAFISGKAQRDCFAELGVEEYEFVATLDRKTSEICREHDGKVHKVKDYKPGTNAPPMHCWCRSCIVPYFDDVEGRMGERAARDPDIGKRAMVPADMTYSEWEKKFSNRTSSQNRLINDIIPRGSNRGVSKVSDVHYVGKLDKSLYECVTKDIRTDDVIITDERIQHIKDHHPKDYERFMQYFPLIVAAPDYIFEANLPNTAFLLKTFRTKNENFNIILRLATSDDPDNYSNSIITFMKTSDKKARKYIRNKKKLYTRPNNSYNESS